MKQFTLTKEEFITRSMAGEVFVYKNYRLFYDPYQIIPFRLNEEELDTCWKLFNGKELFTLEQPKPRIERRWKWRKDTSDYTEETDCYHNDANAISLIALGMYKAEDCFIDIEIRD